MAEAKGAPAVPSEAVATHPELAGFWAAAARGVLLVPFCRDCGKPHWYPRAICPRCFSDAIDWREAAGTGTVYSYSVMRRAPVPYAIAYVTLAEGVTMMTNIVDCDFDQIAVGQQVRLVFRQDAEGNPAPMFTAA